MLTGVRIALVLVCIAGVVGTFVSFSEYRAYGAERIEPVREQLIESTERAAARTAEFIAGAQQAAEAVAAELSA